MNTALQHYLGLRTYSERALKMVEDSRRGVTNYELKDVKNVIKDSDLADSVMVMPGNEPFLTLIEKNYDGAMDSNTGKKLADQRAKDITRAVENYASSNDLDLKVEIANIDPSVNFQSPYLIEFWVYEKPFKAESKQRVNGRLQTVYNWSQWDSAKEYVDKYYVKWAANTMKARKAHWIYYGAQQLIITHDYFKDNYLDGQYPISIKESKHYINMNNYIDNLKGLGIDMNYDATDRSADENPPEFIQDQTLMGHIQAIADYIGVAAKDMVEAMNMAKEDPESWKSIGTSSIRRYLGFNV